MLVAHLAATAPLLIPSVIAPYLAYLICVWVEEEAEREALLLVLVAFCYGSTASTLIALALHSAAEGPWGWGLLLDLVESLLLAPSPRSQQALGRLRGLQGWERVRRARRRRGLRSLGGPRLLGARGCAPLHEGEEPHSRRVVRGISCTASHAACSALARLGAGPAQVRGGDACWSA